VTGGWREAPVKKCHSSRLIEKDAKSGTNWGELGYNSGWEKLRGGKPYFILLIQFPAGRSG
jgi:hypothetical protein